MIERNKPKKDLINTNGDNNNESDKKRLAAT